MGKHFAIIMLLFFSFFNFYCKKNVKELRVKYSISENKLNTKGLILRIEKIDVLKNSISYEIINTSKNSIFLILNTDSISCPYFPYNLNLAIYSDNKPIKSNYNNLCLPIINFDRINRIKNEYLEKGIKVDSILFEEYLKNYQYKKIIYPHKKYKFTSKLPFNVEKSIKTKTQCYFEINKDKEYKMNLIYHINPNYAYNQLTDSERKFFKEKNISVFYGDIYSNVVTFKIE